MNADLMMLRRCMICSTKMGCYHIAIKHDCGKDCPKSCPPNGVLVSHGICEECLDKRLNLVSVMRGLA